MKICFRFDVRDSNGAPIYLLFKLLCVIRRYFDMCFGIGCCVLPKSSRSPAAAHSKFFAVSNCSITMDCWRGRAARSITIIAPVLVRSCMRRRLKALRCSPRMECSHARRMPSHVCFWNMPCRHRRYWWPSNSPVGEAAGCDSSRLEKSFQPEMRLRAQCDGVSTSTAQRRSG